MDAGSASPVISGVGPPRRAFVLGTLFVALGVWVSVPVLMAGPRGVATIVLLGTAAAYLAAAASAFRGQGKLIWLGTGLTIIGMTVGMLLALLFAALAITSSGGSIFRTTPLGGFEYLALIVAAVVIIGGYGLLVWLLVRMTRRRI